MNKIKSFELNLAYLSCLKSKTQTIFEMLG